MRASTSLPTGGARTAGSRPFCRATSVPHPLALTPAERRRHAWEISFSVRGSAGNSRRRRRGRWRRCRRRRRARALAPPAELVPVAPQLVTPVLALERPELLIVAHLWWIPVRLSAEGRVRARGGELLLATGDLVGKPQRLAEQLAQGRPFVIEPRDQPAPRRLQQARPGLTRERSQAGDERGSTERIGTAIDGVDLLRQLRGGSERAAEIAALLEPRHLLARRGRNRLLDADRSSGEKLRRCLGRGNLRERLCETVVKRLVAPLEVGQRRPRVRVPAVLVEDQGLEDERLGEESFLEERRVQREQISQSSLVLAAAEMRPARLEQRVEPLRRPSSHAVVEGRRQCVVAPLVSEPRELEVRFLPSLGRGRITARNGKRRHGEELLGGLRGISCR